MAGVDQLDQALAQLRSRIDVDLPADRDHGLLTCRTAVQREIHGDSSDETSRRMTDRLITIPLEAYVSRPRNGRRSMGESFIVVQTRRVFDPEAAALRLAASPGRRDRLTHLEMRAGRDADLVGWPEWVHPCVVDAALARGVVALWSHQARAATLAHDGTHTVVATGTASGKSLGLPVAGPVRDRREHPEAWRPR